MTQCIQYNAGYKYQLKSNYSLQTELRLTKNFDKSFIALDSGGMLTIKTGYAWDGPSGPTIDTPNFMRGSLVHDALYQLMRERHLDHTQHRDIADRLLQRLCIEDGMSSLRAWGVYQAVHLLGDPFADPANRRPPIKAPENCTG